MCVRVLVFVHVGERERERERERGNARKGKVGCVRWKPGECVCVFLSVWTVAKKINVSPYIYIYMYICIHAYAHLHIYRVL